MTNDYSGNPLIRHKFTADPTALLHDGRIYLYTGHDESPPGSNDYHMNEWLCFSSENLLDWNEHAPLKATRFSWSKGGAFASKVIRYRQQFYWFISTNHRTIPGTAIGVAVSENPEGPFRDAIGHALVTMDMLPSQENEKANLDPSVLIDDDGAAWLFWGNKQCFFARLQDDLSGIAGPIQTIDLPHFEEGSHIHKRADWYYLSYGYGMPEQVAYAMSRNIQGPWEFKGILNGLVTNCETNRPCIMDLDTRTLFFYHNGALPTGGSHRRSVCADELFYNEDGTIKRIMMTSTGVRLPLQMPLV